MNISIMIFLQTYNSTIKQDDIRLYLHGPYFICPEHCIGDDIHQTKIE